jgi:hypothetical protein
MDFKKFGLSILALGAIILIAGGLIWVSANSTIKKMDRKVSESAIQHGLSYVSEEKMGYLSEIRNAQERKGNVVYILIAGAVVVFVGGAMMVSARKPQVLKA